MKILFAIDIGSNGAIAVKVGDNIEVHRLSKDSLETVLKEHAKNCRERKFEIFAVVEKVQSSPQMGVVSAFKFGENKGRVYGALRALEIPFIEIMPKKWQKIFPLPKLPKGASKEVKQAYKVQHKRDLYQKAKDLYPTLAKTQDTADALLMLHWIELYEKGAVKA